MEDVLEAPNQNPTLNVTIKFMCEYNKLLIQAGIL